MNTLTERIDTLEADDKIIRDATNPQAKAAYTEKQLDDLRHRFDFNGVDVTPAAVLAQAKISIEEKYTADLETSIHANEAGLVALEQDANRAIEEAAEIPDDPALASPHSPDQVRLLARIASSLERSDAERRLNGKTPEEVLRIYSRAGDAELARVIEEQALSGWRDVTLAKDQDAGAFLDLKEAVDRRRAARARERAPEAFEVKARIAKLKSSAVRSMLPLLVRR